ncbi:anaerobic ribonucleoside-triphosphate reductase activating protein [Anaerocolumna aminovalerica]|nr:anaerobic ribonucleoside-triphosphate reductase activating protein [Anaerocolumna aminovalerica]
MRYAKIRYMDISNGHGIRVSLFVQGCNFKCKGCFNQDSWDFNGGKVWTKEIEDNFIELCKKSYIDAISILGGEPLQQDEDLLKLVIRLKKEVKKPISLWTGYNFENIPNSKKVILNFIDEITDGQFIEELKDFNLKFKGSSNQHVYKKGIDY